MDELFSSPELSEFPLSLHLSMLNDDVRMGAFEQAMKAVIKPGDVVLDVGTGTGILAMMASEMGASRVIGIDKSDIVDYAVSIKNLNRPDSDIEFIKSDVFDTALKGLQADVVICELFGNFGIDENVVDVLTHVRENSLRPKGRMLPSNMELVVAAAQCTNAYRDVAYWKNTQTRYDFSPLQDLAYHTVYQITNEPVRLLSDPTILETVEFLTVKKLSQCCTVELPITKSGVVHGVVGWFRSNLGEGVMLDTGPMSPSTHWGQVLFPIGQPVRVKDGACLKFEFSEQGDREQSVWNWSGSLTTSADADGTHSFNYRASREFSG